MADTINYIRKEGQRKYVSDTEFTSLDKSTIPVGTEYNIVGAIEESDLSAELQTKINSTITIEQTTGSNTGTVMSQKAVTDELDKKITGVTIINSDAEEVGTVSKLFFDSKYNEPQIVPGNWLNIPTPKTKTINNQSILGTGNISLPTAGDVPTVVQSTGTSTASVMSQNAVTTELGKKQPLIDAATTLNLNSVIGSGLIQGGIIVAQSDMRAYATLNPNSLNFTRSDETPTIVTDNSTLTIPSNKTGTIATTDDITNATQNFITAGAITGKQDKLTAGTGITITTGNVIYCNGSLTGVDLDVNNIKISGKLDMSGSLIRGGMNYEFPGKSGTLALTSDIPAFLIPGDNISITKASDSEKVTISATGLVKQVTNTVDYDRLYGRTSGGNETTYKIVAYGTDVRSMAQRTEAGQLRTNDPTNPLDAVNKQYFEANGVMQVISYSSDNKTISPTELALLKSGFYIINSTYTITNGTDSLPKDYYAMIKQGYASAVPYNDSTYLFQSYSGKVYAYSQYGVNGYENKSAFYKLATTSDITSAINGQSFKTINGESIKGSGDLVTNLVLIDNSLLGG